VVSVKKLAVRYFTLSTLFIYFYHSFRLKNAEVIINESHKKVTDLKNEVRGLNITVEKKEHAIKALREEKDDCLNRYVYLYFFTKST
jgi:shikimate 5-dehydrogenase